MIADVGKDARKRRRRGQQSKSLFEVPGGNGDGESAGIHVERAGRGTCGGLLLDALPLPSPDLFAIHSATPDPSCIELACSSVLLNCCAVRAFPGLKIETWGTQTPP
jgi:hypothetical protein